MQRKITRRDFLETAALALPASAALSSASASSERPLPFKLGVQVIVYFFESMELLPDVEKKKKKDKGILCGKLDKRNEN